MKPFPSCPFIDGQPRKTSSGRPLVLVNPATEETLCEVAGAGVKEVDLAVQGAQRAYEQVWRDLAPGRRTERLFAIARQIREHAEDLARWESWNIGKPISDARDEVELGARIFDYYAGAVTRCCGQTIPVARGGFDYTLRQPLGVVGAIVPWNFPFPIACWKVAPALAAGNTVILKPASLSPLTGLGLGELASRSGLPDGVLQVLAGRGSEIGDALLEDSRIRKISFTGSSEVGSRLMARAARGMKRVSLELGGKSPNIVFADADLDRAIESSPMSVFANTGQDCCARSRVFVESSVFDRFVEGFAAATGALVVGDPMDERTQIGPLVSSAQRESVEAFVAEARGLGRRVLRGGGRPPGRGYYLEPAIVTEVATSDRIWREEVFGPVVCLRPFDDEAALLREVNDSPYGLSGSIWTNDLKRALRVARRVESGVLSINSHSSVHVEAPFGGFKMSGMGRDLGMAAMEGYTELKNIYMAE